MLALRAGADLDQDQQLPVEQHLQRCPECEAHSRNLNDSREILELASVAGRMPRKEEPSLWPAIEARLPRDNSSRASYSSAAAGTARTRRGQPVPVWEQIRQPRNWVVAGLSTAVCAMLVLVLHTEQQYARNSGDRPAAFGGTVQVAPVIGPVDGRALSGRPDRPARKTADPTRDATSR